MRSVKDRSAGPVPPRSGLVVPPLTIDRRSRTPLYAQVYGQLADALSRADSAGARLPSTRLLARMLGVSRNTVVMAYDELVARGIVEGRPGSGMVVAARGVPATGACDAVRVLRDAQYPGRTVALADPDGAPLYLTY